MKDRDEFVVGVDVGSSSARAIAIGPDGDVVDTAMARYPHGGDLPMGEVNPETWLAGTIEAIAAISSNAMQAICVGGHGPTSVARDGQRALTFRHAAGQGGTAAEQHMAQAVALEEMFGPKTQPRQQWDWILSRMGGSETTQGHWPGSPVLAGFGDAVPVGSAVGRTADVPGIPDGIALVPGSNDAFMCAWGSGIDVPGKAFDPGGRTGGIGVAVEAGADTEFSKYGMPSAVPNIFVVGGPVAAHGTMLDWWSEITGRSVSELLELAAKVAPGAEGVMILPFLEGERAPRWNHGLRAEILGLHSSSGVGVITRALLEGTAYGLGHIQKDLEARGVHMGRLISSGGPSRSQLWTEIKAAVLEVPIDVPSCDELAAYGAALGAGAAVDWWPRPGEGKSGDWPHPAMTTIEPQPLEVYRKGLARFIELGNEAETRLNKDRSTP